MQWAVKSVVSKQSTSFTDIIEQRRESGHAVWQVQTVELELDYAAACVHVIVFVLALRDLSHFTQLLIAKRGKLE